MLLWSEQRMGEQGPGEAGFEEYMSQLESIDYLDLTDPWLR